MAIVQDQTGSAATLRGRPTAVTLSIVAAALGAAIIAGVYLVPQTMTQWGVDRALSTVPASLLAAGVVFMLAGGLVALGRLGLGGTIALTGVLLWLAGCIAYYSFGWVLAAPALVGFLGAFTGMVANDQYRSATDGGLVLRQGGVTRLTHWVWAVVMFFMLLSGLQIFQARPNLYIGPQSGFGFENSILDIYAVNTPNGPRGQTKLFGQTFDTTGWLGMTGPAAHPNFAAFPSWATIPSYRDLATGRVVHFFFAWILVGTLFIWLVNALITGHLWRDIIIKPRDVGHLPRDILDHIRFRFAHGRTYTPLQKFAYFGVLVIAFPVIILTGLAMSPGMDTAWPWLVEAVGGRQTARTIHFITMLAFVLFFVVHIIMVIVANPVNELRSMITGYYRTNARGTDGAEH